MKKTLLFLFMLGAHLQFNAQTVIFEETFDQIGDDRLPTGWVSEDRDGEGSRWLIVDTQPNMGGGMIGNFIATASMNASGDHLLITPDINLPGNSSYSLTFQTSTFPRDYDSNNPTNSSNRCAVYVLPSAAMFTGDEVPVFDEIIPFIIDGQLKTIDLSGYAGQNIKIYFRQYNSPASQLVMLLLDTIRITRQDRLATSEVKQESAVGIYPNPASDYVYFKSKSKITKADVYDMAGRKLNVKLDHERLDVKDIQPGTYIIASESENKKSTHKLIKK